MVDGKVVPMSLSRDSVKRLVKLNLTWMTVCLVISVTLTFLMLRGVETAAFARGMVIAVLLPLLTSLPILGYMSFHLLRLWESIRRLEGFAHRDALTQMLNRGAFTLLVEERLAEMRSLSSARGALLVADADHFKAVNDRWGHAVGDDALRLISLAMSTVLQRDDALGRLGGEEFGIFLYGSSSVSARNVAERLRTAVEALELRTENGEIVPLTISIGAVHFRQAQPFTKLYNDADRNLYVAKANGRNRVAFEDAKVEVDIDIEDAA